MVEDGISIAICTRNRVDDLEKCVSSLGKQNHVTFPVEVLIIDDGDIGMYKVRQLRHTVENFKFSYIKKDAPGLWKSRIQAFRSAIHAILLFIDDDVELDENYLSTLYVTYKDHPDAVAVGGVDQKLQSKKKWNLFSEFFGYSSGKPGRLSPSGYGGSMPLWTSVPSVFKSEYLSGCNMSFRRSVISSLTPVSWLTSYSLGEDLYLSYLASCHGHLLINPKLRLNHNQSPVSRDKREEVAFTEIANHYRLLKIKNSLWRQYLFQFWTIVGLFVRSIIQGDSRSLKGQLKATRYIVWDLLNYTNKV